MYQENIDTQEGVVIGDGAAWIWNLANEHFPNGVQIVDYMHAKSHLYTVAKQAFGELETQVVEEWVEATEPFLYDGNTQKVVERISALDTQNPDVVQILEREAGYFKKHSERMQYRTISEKGYQIWSGVIESACKHVVAERCKRASMRWTKEGLNAVLTWKCIHKNGSWVRNWYPDTKTA